MSLSQYKKKRNFSDTPEPEGKEKSSAKGLRFVIQKHDASHLHYDFRLELKGVLKSWAIPKGPSLNPADKRLAMMVEDHPYDYRNFEGIIPAGNYGGGTVIVWDEGTYEPMEAGGLSKAEQEKLLMQQLQKGDVKLTLHGKKINGSYAIFRLKKAGDNSWLLVKKVDNFCSDDDVTKQNQSVKTGKTIAEVATENGTLPNHPEEDVSPASPVKKTASKKASVKKAAVKKVSPKKAAVASSKKKASVKKATAKKASPKKTPVPSSKKKVHDIKKLLGQNLSIAKKSSIPIEMKPMLATLVDKPFDSNEWLYEIKWDGYRALGYVDGKEVALMSRNNNSFSEKYYPVTEALKELNIQAVFDGEIVAMDESGLSDFQLLQNWQNEQGLLRFYIFDVLWVEGYNVTMLPLIERKALLQKLLPQSDHVLKYSDHVVEQGISFFEAALKQGLEGIMAKKASSLYEVNSRASTWLKIKVNMRQEVVIVGFTQPRNTRKFFGALLLGVYDKSDLVYVGHTGSGFNQQTLEEIYKKLKPLIIDKCPLKICPKGNMPETWVKPQLVCEIKFTEWTKDHIARHPIFMGLREDKKPGEVRLEKSTTVKAMEKKTSKAAAPKKAVAKDKAAKTTAQTVKAPSKKTKSQLEDLKKASAASAKTSGLVLSIEDGKDQEVIINGHELKLTNLYKFYWKKEKGTKLDSINYFSQVAPFMMPYMKDRPQSLNRHPNGIEGSNFYQKDMKGKLPEWMQTHKDFSESTDKEIEYLVCSNEATLIYMANLGCIEMHPWHSRTQSWQQPDWCLIDLDPDTGNTFDQVIEIAQNVNRLLDSIGAKSCVKTSGSSGIHIYIPLGAKYSYEQSKQLAEVVVNLVHQELPDITSVERNPAKRKGKIYLDFLQNRETQTAAAPYSLRPKPGMPVSTPLHWDEVKKGLTPTTYNMHNIFERLKTEGDLFKPVLEKGIDLEKVLSKLETIIK